MVNDKKWVSLQQANIFWTLKICPWVSGFMYYESYVKYVTHWFHYLSIFNRIFRSDKCFVKKLKITVVIVINKKTVY